MAENALILQNEREKFISKLQDMRLNNLTAKQQKKLSKNQKRFLYEFNHLSYSFFSLSEYQLKEFSKSELKELDKLISHKAWPWAICQMLFTFGVSIVGWLGGGFIGFWAGEFHSWIYLYRRKYFKKIYGKDSFPFDIKTGVGDNG